MDKYIDVVKKSCKTECGIETIVISALAGMSLSRYNRQEHRDEDQWIIDSGIKALNDDIITFNAANGFSTPLLNHFIHPTMGNSRRNRNTYSRLRDGLHPTKITLWKWAEAIVASMRLNKHLPDHPR